MTESAATEAQNTLLVVYDSRAIRDTLTVLDFGPEFRLVAIDDPAEVVGAVQRECPDLVILCAMARETTAYDNCQKLRQILGDRFLPILIYSLRGASEDLTRAYAAGADDLVLVNLAPEELLFRVRTLLRLGRIVGLCEKRSHSLARASSQAADMMLQLEEAGRRIQDQNRELERMQGEIAGHLRRLEQELELAASLQFNLLPTVLPDLGEIRLHDRYLPAAQLCGDYYDCFALPDGRCFLCVADVTGHGVAPALVSVQVRTLARSLALSGLPLGELMSQLNNFMFETFNREFLMTTVAMVCDPNRRWIECVGAGHPPLIHLAADGKDWREWPSRGLPLGVTGGAEFHTDGFELRPGERLLAYTDGLTEVEGEDEIGFFGHQRLAECFAQQSGRPGAETPDQLLAAARRFSAAGTFADDVTVLLLERPEVAGAPA